MNEIKLIGDKAKAEIIGFNVRDGTFFVLRKIEVKGNRTHIKCLHIGKSSCGEAKNILLQRAVSSLTEAIQEMKNEEY